jgi:hypothetical protein
MNRGYLIREKCRAKPVAAKCGPSHQICDDSGKDVEDLAKKPPKREPGRVLSGVYKCGGGALPRYHMTIGYVNHCPEALAGPLGLLLR